MKIPSSFKGGSADSRRTLLITTLSLLALSNLAIGQLNVTTNPSGSQVVDTGTTFCVDMNYAWASTTTNLNGAELRVSIPAEFGGTTPADYQALTSNPHIDTVTFDTNSRELIFDFVDPLEAGTSGILKFCVSHSNGSTQDGTATVLGINFSAPGETASMTSISVEANASSKIDISKATIGNIQPAQGQTTPYRITVNNDQGPGNYDAVNTTVVDTLPPGATFIGSSPTPDSTAVDDKGTPETTDDVTALTWNFASIPAGSAKQITLQVQYGDPIGTVVTNVVDYAGEDPFGNPVARSASDPRTVSAPAPGAGFTKNASTAKVSLSSATDNVTETIAYNFNISNTGNVLLNDYVVEDTFPAGFFPTRLWTGHDTLLAQENNVKVEYQLAGAPGTWVEHAGSPFLSPFTGGNNEVDLTVLGDTVTALRWTFDTLPIAYNNSGNTRVFGEYRAPASDGDTVTNAAKASDPTDTSTVNVGSTVDVEIEAPSPRPDARKVITSPISGGPTDTISYQITVTNSYGASTTLDSPVVTDILPANVTFVPGSVVATPALTTFTQGVDGGTGRPLLTFDWTGQSILEPAVNPSAGPGSTGSVTLDSFTVTFDVTVDPGTSPQALVNDASLTYSNSVINDSSGNANATPTSTFTVLETGLLDARKWVVGDLNLPSTDPDDLDPVDGDDDQAYETRFPDTGQIVPGGQFRYRVTMFNPGNEPLDNIRVMEILPWVGDRGIVATGDFRGSDWQANLIQHSSQSTVFPAATVTDALGGTAPQAITVRWSTSTNPIRSDLDATLGDPTGGDVGSFNSGALPADLTTVRSLLFEFPALTLQPLETVELFFFLRAPEAAPSDAIAWNSIGRAADVARTSTPILPSEALKAGVKIDSVSLGSLVWIDSAAGTPVTEDNGIKDGTENPLANARVELFQYVNSGSGLVLQRAQSAFAITTGLTDEITPSGSPLLTDAGGLYEFTGLMPSNTTYDGVTYGDFVVQVSPPAGLENQYLPGSNTAGGYEADPNLNGDNNNNGIDTGSGNVLRSGDITLTLDAEPIGDGQTSGDDADGNFTIDFAYVANDAGALLANLGSVVWLDEDADGVKDGGESAIENATVTLYDVNGLPVTDAHGNAVDPVMTDASGAYSFIDLLPGDFIVEVTPPAPPAGADPFQPTPVTGTLDNENHGIAHSGGANGGIADGDIVSPTVTLNAGDTDNTIDFGLIRPLSLGDAVWIDGNTSSNTTALAGAGNGTQDAGEDPFVGVSVELFNADGTPAQHIDGSLVAAVTTNATGAYLFTNLLPGDYIVRVALPANYQPATSGGDPDNDDNTDSNAGILAANLGSLTAGDIVSDPVTLDIGFEPTNDGDSNPDSNRSVDFGFVPVPADLVSIGNTVWFDRNANGVQDPGEPGVPGVRVRLFEADGTTRAESAYLDPIEVVTGASGSYEFTNLLPGDYRVSIDQYPTDYFLTPITGVDPEVSDSDTDSNGVLVNATRALSPVATLLADSEPIGEGGTPDDNNGNLTIDFGLTQTVSVGNYVWVDSTASGTTLGNGIQDPGENPFPNGKVWLLVDTGGGVYVQADDADGNPAASVTTDINGFYEFTNLMPGSNYVVALEEPQYYDFTPVGNADPNDESAGFDTDNNGVGLHVMNIDGLAGNETLVISGPITLHAATEPLLDDGAGAAYGTPSDANGNGAVDFGLVPEVGVIGVSVGDFVWLDDNRNGVRDGTEAGIAGATVTLLDSAGQPVLDADLNPVDPYVTPDGSYSFTNLIPGTYKIRVTPPAGHAVVRIGGANPDLDTTNDDNNAVQVSNQTYAETPVFNLAAGEMDASVDIGLVELVSIGNFVWFDLNADGQQAGESGIQNVSVDLLMESSPGSGTYVAATDAYLNSIATDTTDASGNYAFGNLYPGNYKVRVAPPAGTILTPNGGADPDADPSDSDNNGVAVSGQSYVESEPVTLDPNLEPVLDGGTPDDNNGNYTVDFGFIEPVSLGDIVWWDRDGDGTQGPLATEPGIANATVTLIDNSTGVRAKDKDGTDVPDFTTAPGGAYNFTDLLPGDYKVRVTPPAGSDFILTGGSGVDPLTDNNGLDVGQPYVESAVVTLSVRGETGDGDADPNNDPTVDFGFVQTVSVGDSVWLDVNGDGSQAGESGIGNVAVSLFEADGTTVAKDYQGNDVTAVLTDPSGFFEFTGLLEGEYVVRVTPPANHVLTPFGGADPDADPSYTDSNGKLVSGQSYVESEPVTLTVDGEPTTDGGGAPDDDNGNRTVDFGFVQTVSIGSSVFEDADENGNLTGDDPLAGALVELLVDSGGGILVQATDITGAAVAPITTDVTGSYEFDGLYPGNYVVRVTPPVGFVATPINENDPNNNASDIDSNGQQVPGELYAQSVPITLTVNAEPLGDGVSSNSKDENGNGTIDFGFVRTASVGNYVWIDENGDGVQDAGEDGIAGVTVELLDELGTVIATTKTDADGGYLFVNVATGVNRTVRVNTGTLPAGLTNLIFDPDGTPDGQHTVSLSPGQEYLAADFGYNYAPAGATGAPPAGALGAIGDRVWLDADGDGKQDAGEAGIAGVEVNLFDDPDGDGVYDNLLDTTTTGPAGGYIFDDLPAGSYRVEVTPPPAYNQTGDPDGTLDHATSSPLILAPGDVYLNADFGYRLPFGAAPIGDTIYLDVAADGTHDPATDPGIAGVTVALQDAAGNVIATTTTDASGNYLFPGLPVGPPYRVVVSDTDHVLGGLLQTGDPDGGLDGRSTIASLPIAGALDQDFGYAPLGHVPGLGIIGDTVFIDTDASGTLSAGEGTEGITVRLFDASGTTLITSTVTDENGNYRFGGLDPAATYTVRVDTGGTLAGLTNTVDPDTGGDSESVVDLSASGGVDLDQDFGYVGSNSISGLVWLDPDADGARALTETDRFGDVTVDLLDGSGNIIATTTTLPDGSYSFDNVPDGSYTVAVTDDRNVLAGHWHPLGADSAPDPAPVTVNAGSPSATIDFGYYIEPASVGDFVFHDTNGDGLQDVGDAPIDGALVTLTVTYPNGDVVTATTVTAPDGSYRFGNLLGDEDYSASGGAGEPTFELTVVPPAGFLPTLSDVGSDDAIDSDDAQNGEFAEVVQGGSDDTNDFGFVYPPQVTPPGIAGVTIMTSFPETTIPLFPAFEDPDDADNELTYTVTGNTNPALIQPRPIDPSDGLLVLDTPCTLTGSADITVTATDVTGYSASETFTVTVEDNVPPAMTGVFPVVASVFTGGSAFVTYPNITAIDKVDGPAAVTFDIPDTTPFPIGSHTITATAVDGSGNVSMVTFQVHVLEIQPPGSTQPVDLVGLRNDPAPGAGGPSGLPADAEISVHNRASLNNNGDVLYESSLNDGGNAVFLQSGGTTTPIAVRGQNAPDGGKYGRFSHLAVNDSGESIFQSLVNNRKAERGIFLASGGAVTNPARLGETAGATTVEFATLHKPAMTSGGEMLARVNFKLGVGGVTLANDTAIWRSGGGGAFVAREGDPSPIPGTNYGQIHPRVVAADGSDQIAFAAHLNEAVFDPSDNTALFAGDINGPFSVIVREGDPAPGEPGVSFFLFRGESINSTGQVVFHATVSGSGISSANDEGIWTNIGGSIVAVARESEIAPLPGSNVRFARFENMFIGDDGTICFYAYLTGPTVNSRNDGSIWRYNSGTGDLSLVAREGQNANNTDGAVLLTISDFESNNTGGVAFHSTLVDGIGDAFGPTHGVWFDSGTPGGVPMLVMRRGDLVDFGGPPYTVTNIAFETQSNPGGGTSGYGRLLNDAGEMLLKLSLDQNLSGLFKILP